MDAIRNLLEFLWGFISRRDFVEAYLLLTGFAFAVSGARGLIRQEMHGFGLGPATLRGVAATRAAGLWLVVGLGLLLSAFALWQAA